MSHEKLDSALSDNTSRTGSDKSALSPKTSLYYGQEKSGSFLDTEDLGPLPPKWEKAVTDNGEVYFIE